MGEGRVGCIAGLIWAGIVAVLLFLMSYSRVFLGSDEAFLLFGVLGTAWFWGGFFLTHFLVRQHAEVREKALRDLAAAGQREKEEERARNKAAENEERRKREELARANAERARKAEAAARERERIEREFQAVGNISLVALTEIPSALLQAEELLDLAEGEFGDGAFSPFWDAIEPLFTNWAMRI